VGALAFMVVAIFAIAGIIAFATLAAARRAAVPSMWEVTGRVVGTRALLVFLWLLRPVLQILV
jgi:hypothetical protein